MCNTARQTRENRTITVDFQNEATYVQLLGDGRAFVEFVVAFLLSLDVSVTPHRPILGLQALLSDNGTCAIICRY
jgi:hypothetical protein